MGGLPLCIDPGPRAGGAAETQVPLSLQTGEGMGRAGVNPANSQGQLLSAPGLPRTGWTGAGLSSQETKLIQGYRETRKYQAGQQPRPKPQDTSESPGGGGQIQDWTHGSSTPQPLPATCAPPSTHHRCVFNTLSPSYVHEWPSSMDWRAYLSENACCLMRENLCTFKTEKSLRTFWLEWEE